MGNEFSTIGAEIVAKAFNQRVRAAGLELLKKVILPTPVRTGRARGNWNTSINQEDGSIDLAIGDVNTKAISEANARMSEGGQVIAKIKFFDGEELLISNGLPYIAKLEDGSSQQAAKGWVKLAVREVRPILEEARKAATLGPSRG